MKKLEIIKFFQIFKLKKISFEIWTSKSEEQKIELLQCNWM